MHMDAPWSSLRLMLAPLLDCSHEAHQLARLGGITSRDLPTSLSLVRGLQVYTTTPGFLCVCCDLNSDPHIEH